MSGLCRPALIAALLALAAVACSGGDSATPTPAIVPPAFTESSCLFVPPARVEVKCGYVNVLARHDDPGSGYLQLAVTVFKATAPVATIQDPVIYLDGGPGGHTIANLGQYFEPLIRPFLGSRDFIAFDQRGVGYSLPALECPEVEAVSDHDLGEYITRGEYSTEFIKAAGDCRNRLQAQGIDPTIINSHESVRDLEDIRRALGYDMWNLIGISYGTRLALTAMRDQPEHIRSVILDSTYPPEVDLYEDGPADYDRALHVLFSDCSANDYCSSHYPDLESDFNEAVARLNRAPKTERPFLLAQQRPVVISGDTLLEIVYTSLYSAELIPDLPAVIEDAFDGDLSYVSLIAASIRSAGSGVSYGAYFSVQCTEEAPFSSRSAVGAALTNYDSIQGNFRGAGLDLLDACKAYGIPAPDPLENQPVTSDIPTLVLAGDYDPITPPDWGRAVADRLTHSYFYVIPDVGHATLVGSDCASAMGTYFINDPDKEPKRPCLDNLTAPDFSDIGTGF